MMKQQDVILKVENVSKQYRLGVVGTGTISHDFNRFLAKVTGKEDPYLKIGESNDRSTKGTSEYVWALKDIDFEVKRGEILGIIGKNGAGKSTFLKILSKVTAPTTGCIKYNGRIASLLEVGTGFHPEMTGKENIFLNGAILGMTKKEISRKLDEIIEFSGCERYVDTPVKRYSSGMKVRLAFAVAAFLEPDILIVDEVLAVGDTEFQKKAIGKMQDISSQAERTVLFVSHDMGAIQSLCTRAILLVNGELNIIGKTKMIISEYFKAKTIAKEVFPISVFNNSLSIIDFHLHKSHKKEIINIVAYNDDISIIVKLKGNRSDIEDLLLEFKIYNKQQKLITTFSTYLLNFNLKFKNGDNQLKVNCDIRNIILAPNNYYISLIIMKKSNLSVYRIFDDLIQFKMVKSKDFILKNVVKPNIHGDIIFNHKWN